MSIVEKSLLGGLRAVGLGGSRSTAHGGILAAGLGKRLASPFGKALHRVNGIPLVEHVLRQYKCAGIRYVTVAIRKDDSRLLEKYLAYWRHKWNFESIEMLPVEDGTGPAARALTMKIGAHSHLISMVDTIASDGAVRSLCRTGEELNLWSVPKERRPLCVLATTNLELDDSPAWVHIGDDNRVVHIGKSIERSGAIFGNMRWMSAEAVEVLQESRAFWMAQRDTELMRILIRTARGRVIALNLGNIFDVDREVDVAAAQQWLSLNNSALPASVNRLSSIFSEWFMVT